MDFVLLTLPVRWPDDFGTANFVTESLAHPAGTPDDDRNVVFNGQQGNRFVRRSLLAEKIHEFALVPGVLIGDEAQRAAIGENLVGRLRRAFFVQESQTALGPHV